MIAVGRAVSGGSPDLPRARYINFLRRCHVIFESESVGVSWWSRPCLLPCPRFDLPTPATAAPSQGWRRTRPLRGRGDPKRGRTRAANNRKQLPLPAQAQHVPVPPAAQPRLHVRAPAPVDLPAPNGGPWRPARPRPESSPTWPPSIRSRDRKPGRPRVSSGGPPSTPSPRRGTPGRWSRRSWSARPAWGTSPARWRGMAIPRRRAAAVRAAVVLRPRERTAVVLSIVYLRRRHIQTETYNINTVHVAKPTTTRKRRRNDERRNEGQVSRTYRGGGGRRCGYRNGPPTGGGGTMPGTDTARDGDWRADRRNSPRGGRCSIRRPLLLPVPVPRG